MKAIVARARSYGDASVLDTDEIDVTAPAAGEVLVRQTAAGINFIDVYQRNGTYRAPSLPAPIGVEAAGVVEAVGDGVRDLRVGDRVAYAGVPGAYASARVVPAARLVHVPDDVADETAAIALARGITVQMLLGVVFAVREGSRVLVHAAAGGLGEMLVREAKSRGAFVIGTVGSEDKASIARAAGADHVVVGRDADFATEVDRVTGGRRVDVAYDGVGGTTLLKTLDCVRPFGVVASIGQAGGTLPTIPLEELGPRRSLMLARPSVMRFMADIDAYREAANAVFARRVFPRAGRGYDLARAADAHRDLESGRNTGASWIVTRA